MIKIIRGTSINTAKKKRTTISEYTRLLMILSISALMLFTGCISANKAETLEQGFKNPPENARPWVFWFWINGNISKKGITADLESFKQVGIGGVLWMEVSGPKWAPDGDVVPLSPEWNDAYQWAISECERLGLTFNATLDFGYGSGGPHITPECSMQKLVWSETSIDGGKTIDVVLERPALTVEEKEAAIQHASFWLRQGAEINAAVLEDIWNSDSYRDVAVMAIPLPESQKAREYRIPNIKMKAGLLSWRPQEYVVVKTPPDAVTPTEKVIDLTDRMKKDGSLQWDAPPGRWLVIRYGHETNLKMTRPCPAAAVGLECDRLAKIGIETHFDAFLKPIIENAGPMAGGTLAYAHIDSWEAGGQNWTASFPEEFLARRGYNLRPWLPVLTGRVVASEELSERFLWDMRTTVSEMVQDNYATRLREMLRPYGMKLSIEAYGSQGGKYGGLCIDNLAYAGVSDMPISEFWAWGEGLFPEVSLEWGGYARSSKAMASAAHIYGSPVVGAEAFTSGRAWRDHPYLLKAMGDWAFCQGVNRMVLHMSAHQPYDTMIPGLTHRKWGEHFQRYNTWWNFSKPWMDYLSRSQYLLQQGQFVADVAFWYGQEPSGVNDLALEIPEGYDYDLCSSELVLQMEVSKGRIILPSGMSYRYLLLPDVDRMTTPLARKIKELVDRGARVIAQKRLTGSLGLADYQQHDSEIKGIAAELWDSGRLISGKTLEEVFDHDKLNPDFEGEGLLYIHHRVDNTDIYFISNQKDEQQDIACKFRVSGKYPELWDPETGDIRKLPEFTEHEDRITIPLQFTPKQSCFIVFREGRSSVKKDNENKNYDSYSSLREITGEWEAVFDPRWGGPDEPVKFENLIDWSKHSNPKIQYYSGTATYRKNIELSESDVSAQDGRLLLDLGRVAVMARVRLNGQECGIVWKPPYRVNITTAVRAGTNKLEIDVVNLWINRMIGDEQLPEDSKWKDFETLVEWPEWFKEGKPRPSGRFTFSSCKHYKKDTPLVSSGLLGPVRLYTTVN